MVVSGNNNIIRTKPLSIEEIGDLGFNKRNPNHPFSKLWDCICQNEDCKKIFTIKCQPKNWKHKTVLCEYLDGELNSQPLMVYCSDECEEKALAMG